MSLYRTGGGGGKATPTTVELTTTVKGNYKYAEWDLTGITGYQNLVLWESLFPELPAWVIMTLKSNPMQATAEYTYDASTGVLRYAITSDKCNIAYGAVDRDGYTLTIHYFS